MSIVEEDHEVVELSSASIHPITQWLRTHTADLLARIEKQEFWKFVMSPASPPEQIVRFMKQIYLEIVGYQPDVIEAAIASIGQMPRSMNPRWVKSMLIHQADEFDHGEMALKDFVALHGSETQARKGPMSPEAFAVAGVWWMIAQKRDPFAYLGALYLFEGLTPTVTGMVKSQLLSKGLTEQSLGYIEFHSTEDIKHANLVDHLISEVANAYPESIESMKYGFRCFEAVYPIPLWSAAYQRAKSV